MNGGTERDYRNELAVRTQEEVAEILGIDRRSVQQTEQRAFEKCQKQLLALDVSGDGEERRRGERERGSGGDFPPAPFRPCTPAPLPRGEHVFARYARTVERWETLARLLEADGDPAAAAEIRIEAETFNLVLTRHAESK